jgi:hypothetical protein
MNLPILGRVIDERFLNHRLRSTSAAGVIGGAVAIGLFAYRYYVDHLWSWDLLTVSLTIVVVKVVVLIWYRVTD